MSLWYVNPRPADARSFDGRVRDERHQTYCVLFQEQQEVPKRVHNTRAVERNWRWSRACSAPYSDDWEGRCNSGLFSSLSEVEQIEGMMITISSSKDTKMLEACETVSLAERARLHLSSLVAILDGVMWSFRFQELDCRKSAERFQEGEKTKRKESQCQVESDTATGPVSKTMRVLFLPSLGEGLSY